MTPTRTPYVQRSPEQMLVDWRTRPTLVSPRSVRYPGAVVAQAVLDMSDPATFPGAFADGPEVNV